MTKAFSINRKLIISRQQGVLDMHKILESLKDHTKQFFNLGKVVEESAGLYWKFTATCHKSNISIAL